jgi:hypothetical protein
MTANMLKNTQPLTVPMNNPLSFEKVQNDLKMEFLKARLLQNLQANTNPWMAFQQKPVQSNIPVAPKVPQQTSQIPELDHVFSKEKNFRAQIRDVLDFVISTVGKISEEELEKAKRKLSSDKKLTQIFEALVTKYSSSVKTKENIVKYVLRKTFKTMKENLMKEKNMDSKIACGAFVEKYFPESREDLKEKGVNTEDDEELFNALMPFKKNSKNKTMNNNFLVEIFTSDNFKNDYDLFLAGLDDSMFADNYQKIERFTVYIEDCVDKNAYKDIGKFKRLPWLKNWMEKTKETACDLVYYAKRNTIKRKPKKEAIKTLEVPLKKIVKKEEFSSQQSDGDSLTNN